MKLGHPTNKKESSKYERFRKANAGTKPAQPSHAGRATLTVEELAEVLGIGRAAAYNALHKGIIPSIRIGRRFIIPKTALEKWLANGGTIQKHKVWFSGGS